MPRPAQTEEQRNETRRRILSAAQELFDSSGIDAVSMRALGSRVGLTASALYAYFPAKIDLLRALWWETLDELQLRMASLSNDEPDPIVAIRKISRTYIDFGLENPSRFRVLFMTDQGDFAEELKSAGIFHDAYRVFRDRVSEAITQGHFRDNDPDLCAQVIWAGTHGAVNLINSSASFPFVSPILLAETTINALIDGLAASDRKRKHHHV
ncbi:TetR/AcrR family transcriptional regulator [Thalassospira australica]|uniref:TetR/AcrR family transcriptional regulator n=1 Tax=Thalassospira australica TaxID=1528106 RepID=UPI00384CC7E4